MKDAKGHGSNPRGDHSAGVDAVGRWDDPLVSFSPKFLSVLNDAAVQSSQRQGHLPSVVDAGTIRDALSPSLVGHLPSAVQNARIKLTTSLNGEYFTGFGTGRDKDGTHLVIMNPEQSRADYVPGLVHELQHIADKVAGRSVPANLDLAKQNYSKYRNQPAEKRARLAEKTGKIT